MELDGLTYEQQVIQAPRPAGLAYVLYFLLGSLAINTFYLVFEQEERRFILWGLLGIGFASSFILPRVWRIGVHRIIDFASVITLVWFSMLIVDQDNAQRFGNYLGQMVCMFLILFSFRTFRQNDFSWLMVIGMVIMLLCSIPIYAASYIYSVLGFLFLLASGLMVLNLFPGVPDHRPEETALSGGEWARQLSGMLAMSIAIFILCAGVFAGIPQRGSDGSRDRVRQIFGVGSLSAETRSATDQIEPQDIPGMAGTSAYSGFSESFDISNGRSGAIQEDTSPILEVRAPGQQYMRAIAWDTYTGKSWYRSEITEKQIALVQGNRPRDDGSYGRDRERFTRADAVAPGRLGRGSSALDGPEYSQADIKLIGSTSTGKGFLFLPWYTVQVEGNFEAVYADDVGTLRIATDAPENLEDQNREKFVLSKGDSYRARFMRIDRASPAPMSGSLSVGDVARFTQLPDSTPGRLRQLGRALVRDKNDPEAAANEVHRYLNGRKGYTLSPPVLADEELDAVDHWLFESEEGGHCEYFSTAMAVLLRAGGVPCRVITGFAPGTFNLTKGAWVIRGKDAHAWVEVFLPDHGWVPYDPTPSNWTEDVVDTMSGVTSRVSRSLEQYFIYDPQGFWTRDFPRHVSTAILQMQTAARQFLRWASEPLGPLNRGLFLGLIGIPAVVGIGLSLTFARAGIRFGDFEQLRAHRTRQWSWRQYSLMHRRLQRLDEAMPTGLTLPELADYLDGDRPKLANAVRTLAPPFHHFHYGSPGARPGWLAKLKKGWSGVGRFLP